MTAQKHPVSEQFRSAYSLRRRRSRAAALLAASVAPVVAMSFAQQPALGVQKVFVTANQAWLTAGNWTPSGVPTSSDDILVNGGVLDMTISAGAVDAQYVAYTAGTTRRLVTQTTLATNSTLTLHGSGVNPLISVTGNGAFSIIGPNASTGTGTLGVVLNASGDLNVSGFGALTISSVISETGGARGLTKIGSGTMTLTGASTFTGGFAINNGTVSINTLANAGAAQSLGQGSSAVGLGGSGTTGTLIYTGAATSTDRNITTGAAGGTLSTTNDITYSGAINGSGALTKAGTGTLHLDGAGSIGGISSVNVSGGGRLRVDNTVTTNGDRIASFIGATLNHGTFTYVGNSDVGLIESAGALVISAGGNTVATETAGSGANLSSMTFASFSRTGGAVSFNPTGLTTIDFTSAPALSNGIIGGYAIFGSDWATMSGTTVGGYSGYTTDTAPGTWASGQNINLTAGATSTVSADTTINTLRFAGTSDTVSIDSAQVLRVGSGGVLDAGSGSTISGSGFLTTGAAVSDLIVHVPSGGETLTISAAIANSAGGPTGLIKAGSGIMLTDGVNTFTGQAQVVGGTLRIGASGDLLNNTVNVFTGATFDLNGQTKTIGGLAGAGSVTLGGGTLSYGANTASTTFSGVISAGGNLTKVGTGTTTLTGVNTFTGQFNVGETSGTNNGGVVVVDADSRFGTNTNSINIYNGTLRLTGGTVPVINAGTSVPGGTPGVSIASTHALTLNTATNSAIDVPTGQYGEIAAVVSGTGGLRKTGGGVLDMRTGNHVYQGVTIIDGGTLGVNRDANFGQIPGAPTGNAVQLNNGATIRWYSNASVAGLNVNRGITIGTGGGVIDWSHSSGVPLVNHPINSAGGNTLTKTGTNTVQVNVSQAGMDGDLNIIQGRWNTHAAQAAGDGTIYLAPQDISPATAAGVAQLGIGGTNLNLSITHVNPIVLSPTGQGIASFEVNQTNTLTLNGNITGTGGLTKGRVAGTNGVLVLGGTNSYSGDTTILLGTLRVAGGSAIPDGSSVVMNNPPTSNLAALDLNGTSETIGGLSNSGAGPNLPSIAIGNGMLTVNQSATTTFSGAISGVGGGVLRKDGIGMLTLSGTNTYTGNTVIAGGILSVSAVANLGSTNHVNLEGGRLFTTAGLVNPTRNIQVGVAGGEFNSNAFNSTFGNVTGSGTLVKNGAGTLTVNHLRSAGVNVAAGMVKAAAQANPYDVASEAGTSKVTTLTASAGLIDLTNTKIITQDASMVATPVYDGINDVYIYDGVHGLVQKGRGDGTWNGTSGITTSQTDATTGVFTSLAVGTGAELRGLGPTDTELFAGQTINGNSTVVMYTYGGDADMDGDLDGDDYFYLDSNVLQSETVFGWHQGDFNYDGRLNGDDYFILDSNILQAQSSGNIFWVRPPEFSGGGGGSGLTAVPEPASIGLMGLAAVGALRRRRRVAMA